MKILSAKQLRDADAFTVKNENISSLLLMERASLAFVNWFTHRIKAGKSNKILILCGNGNNGGDGLAVARLLFASDYKVEVLLYEYMPESTADFKTNLERLPPEINLVNANQFNTENAEFDIVIDALWGAGLSRAIEGMGKELITWANQYDCDRVSIDIPSGLHPDKYIESIQFQADYTCSFELPKLSFFFEQNQGAVGKWDIVPIGLDSSFIQEQRAIAVSIDTTYAEETLRERNPFGHKNTFGHALIVGGSVGKIGAAMLTAKSCLVGGAGLVTLHMPSRAMNAVHAFCPELMISPDQNENYITSGPHETNNYNCICIGPGLDIKNETLPVLKNILSSKLPLVIDADALNLISRENLTDEIPEGSILTPHPGEFKRLFGDSKNDYETFELQKSKSKELGVYILRKGKYSCITCPDGSCYFNTSGNVSLATAGSGDVLAGLITSFLAQGYSAKESALLAVFIHGASADEYVNAMHTDRMIATQIIHFISTTIGRHLNL